MIFVEAKFEQVEKEWREFYNKASHISPYMSYDFQKVYKNQLWASKNTFCAEYKVYKGYENAQLLVLIPIIKVKNAIYIAGDFRATGYLDLLYSDEITDGQLEQAIKDFIVFMKKYELYFRKINQSSRLCGILNRLTNGFSETIKKGICVNIPFANDYDEYFSMLSKSTRQNIRTVHNRLFREGKKMTLETYIGYRVPAKLNKELVGIYQKRASERSGKANRIIQFVQEKLNPMTLSLNCSDNSFLSVLRFDSVIAGYMQGLITQKGDVAVIPRLAINSDFGVYCPGGVLVTETIRWLIGNSHIRNLDLSRGDEKYKYVYGGKEHYNFDFTISFNSVQNVL